MLSADVTHFIAEMPQTLSLYAEREILNAAFRGRDNTAIITYEKDIDKIDELVQNLSLNGYQIISCFPNDKNEYVIEIAW